MYTSAHFLIRCALPSLPGVEAPHVAMAQAVAVDRLLLSGALLQYAVAEGEGRWWAIVPAPTEWEARRVASALPWYDAEAVQVTELSYFACNETRGFSMN